MGTISSIIDAIRRIGNSSQKSALARQDQYLAGKEVKDRRVELHGAEEDAPAHVFVATVEAQPEEVRSFDGAELAAVAENAAQVSVISARYLGTEFIEPTPHELDAIFSAWAHSEDRHQTSEEAIVQVLGSAFGQYCCKTLNMGWVVVTDEYGSAAAVKGVLKDFRGFPFDSIRKRIDDSEHQFFVPIYVYLKDQSADKENSPDVA